MRSKKRNKKRAVRQQPLAELDFAEVHDEVRKLLDRYVDRIGEEMVKADEALAQELNDLIKGIDAEGGEVAPVRRETVASILTVLQRSKPECIGPLTYSRMFRNAFEAFGVDSL